jgi:Tfp pilus assembly protein PilN
MTQVNFLPASFLERRAGRRRTWRQCALVLAVAACTGVWVWRRQDGLNALETQLQTMNRQLAGDADQRGQAADLEARCQALDRQLRTRQELEQPVQATAVAATLARLMPPSIGLTSLTLVAPRPTPAPKAEDDKPRPEAGEAARPAPELLRVELVGIAPEDVEVADFVGRLTQCPLFTDVKMLYSRALQTPDLQGRQFRIELAVPLDRRYTPAAEPAGGVAHAG